MQIVANKVYLVKEGDRYYPARAIEVGNTLSRMSIKYSFVPEVSEEVLVSNKNIFERDLSKFSSETQGGSVYYTRISTPIDFQQIVTKTLGILSDSYSEALNTEGTEFNQGYFKAVQTLRDKIISVIIDELLKREE